MEPKRKDRIDVEESEIDRPALCHHQEIKEIASSGTLVIINKYTKLSARSHRFTRWHNLQGDF
jgi:hypothetical protein